MSNTLAYSSHDQVTPFYNIFIKVFGIVKRASLLCRQKVLTVQN